MNATPRIPDPLPVLPPVCQRCGKVDFFLALAFPLAEDGAPLIESWCGECLGWFGPRLELREDDGEPDPPGR